MQFILGQTLPLYLLLSPFTVVILAGLYHSFVDIAFYSGNSSWALPLFLLLPPFTVVILAKLYHSFVDIAFYSGNSSWALPLFLLLSLFAVVIYDYLNSVTLIYKYFSSIVKIIFIYTCHRKTNRN